jgi:hypothetical protein
MRVFLTAVTVIVSSGALAAQSADLTKDPEFAHDLSRAIALHGLNCPVPVFVQEVDEDARGKIDRLDCRSADGSKTWSLRRIHGASRKVWFEPW